MLTSKETDRMAAPYSRETTDAKFDALRQEFRGDLNALEGRLNVRFSELEGKMMEMFAGVRGEFASLRSELKVWLIVMGTILGVLASVVGNRLLNLLWPNG